jgi:cytidyltransferase-like protein
MSDQQEHKAKLGLVLGRFQPLHPGHLDMINYAMDECQEVVVCIGSAQRAEPFTIAQRHQMLQKQLEVLYPKKEWRVVDLVDPEPMEIWPEYVKEICGIDGEDNRFYRADQLPEEYEERLRQLGFEVVYVPRNSFYCYFPDGLYRQVSSATEIKAVYKKLGSPILAHDA